MDDMERIGITIVVVPRLERRTGMICPNIIIITSTDGGRDEESESAVQMLTARYSDSDPDPF